MKVDFDFAILEVIAYGEDVDGDETDGIWYFVVPVDKLSDSLKAVEEFAEGTPELTPKAVLKHLKKSGIPARLFPDKDFDTLIIEEDEEEM